MEIDEIRKNIDEVDEKLAELLTKRLELVARASLAKLSRNMPITDEKREAQVISLWVERLAKHGVPAHTIAGFVRMLIKMSKGVQAKLLSAGGARGKHICFIGYSWAAKALAKAFAEQGYRVVIAETGTEPRGTDTSTKICDYVVIADLERFINIVRRDAFARNLAGKIVMDILPDKKHAFSVLSKEARSIGFYYVSSYPVIDPLTPPFGERVLVIPSGEERTAVDDVMRLWMSVGMEPIITSLDEYEKNLAYLREVLRSALLFYALNLCGGDALPGNGIDMASIGRVLGASGNLENVCSTINSVTEDNKHLQSLKHHFLGFMMEVFAFLGENICYSS